MPAPAVISVLARSFLAGEPAIEDIEARGARALGRRWRWLRSLAARFLDTFNGHTRPRHRDVVQFLLADRGFERACGKYRDELAVAEWIAEPMRMRPVAAARGWNLPAIETIGDLANWLGVSDGELEWFADLKRLSHGRLEHYSYQIMPKRGGGARLLESPKPRLKELQRRILNAILDRVPPHDAVHGFVKGRSIATFAAPHINRHALLRLDLADFFPTFPAARVNALFRTLGYPEAVAARLTGIATNAAPRMVWKGEAPELRTVYGRPHLPQGARTSPALANLMAYRLDCRLAGLARSASAAYTRYADDLAFSGGAEFARGVERFAAHAAAIALEEGFAVNHRKTRVMRQGVRQELAGVVVNRKAGLRRRDLEILEATLVNCARHGAASQNRGGAADFRAHLEGRVGFVEMIDPVKGRRLRRLLQALDWEKG